MKTLLLLALVAYSYLSYSQECVQYYPGKTGASWETQNFDAKDKLTGSTKTKVLLLNEVVNGYTLNIENESFDEKSKPVYKDTLQMKCVDGVFLFDMASFLDPQTMTSYEEMQVSIDSKNMEFPGVLSAGLSLKDASLTMVVANQGVKMMTLTILITNRKVESFEDITVPAGTFKAYKISFDAQTKMIFSVKSHSVQYWVPGKGMVRTENYNEKGKLTSYSVLSQISD